MDNFLPPYLMGEPELDQTKYSSLRCAQSLDDEIKSKGPPIVGLFDDVRPSPVAAYDPWSPQVTTIHRDYASRYECRPNQEKERVHWVVIFGYAPYQPHQIINLFSRIGKVVESSEAYGTNWVFVGYSDADNMRKAIGMNGKVLPGGVMIGVAQRTNQYFRDKDGRQCYHSLCRLHDFIDRTPNYSETLDSSTSLLSSPEVEISYRDTCKKQHRREMMYPDSHSIRPLNTSKGNFAQACLPSTATSPIGKFMDFIFSW